MTLIRYIPIIADVDKNISQQSVFVFSDEKPKTPYIEVTITVTDYEPCYTGARKYRKRSLKHKCFLFMQAVKKSLVKIFFPIW